MSPRQHFGDREPPSMAAMDGVLVRDELQKQIAQLCPPREKLTWSVCPLLARSGHSIARGKSP